MSAKFGPAGSSERFSAEGFKTTLQMPGYLEAFGLDHFEYQCGRGVNVSPEKAEQFRLKAIEHNITVSLHSPYYISLASLEEEKRLKSIDYILQSARAVKMLGGDRIVVHSGTCAKISREEALKKAYDTLVLAQKALDEEHLSDIRICPETMGKINQLGTLDEVMQLCKVDERFIPCIDFGHLNARTLGGCNSYEDFSVVLDTVKNTLGEERYKNFHSHFSKIEYSQGGEKKHLTFDDNIFGPNFEPLAKIIAERDLSPIFISESAGTQDIDALEMKSIYLKYKG
ncbi:MAG: TIM barrel protein [Clostridia bacterium]|nr:TIM barrel protein [Clostridia bacterium]